MSFLPTCSLLWTPLLVTWHWPQLALAQNRPFTAFSQSFPPTFGQAPPSAPQFTPAANSRPTGTAFNSVAASTFNSAPTTQFNAAPAAAAASNRRTGCALILPGTTPSGQEACISFEDVNAAFNTAKAKFGLPPVRGRFQTQDIGNLGILIFETSRILAQQHKLDKDAIANGLSLIDTIGTAIESFCPPFLMTPKCEVTRYRSLEGICNNLENPNWGSAMNSHHRFLPPDFADGIAAPRLSATGRQLPPPRAISTRVHKDEGFHDHAVTNLLVTWGQYLDHDITLTGETKDSNGKTPSCCQDGVGARAHADCIPIDVPANDAFFAQFNRRCLNMVRNLPGLKAHCRLGPRDSFNEVSSIIDAGAAYSNIPDNLVRLRTFQGGQMKMLDAFPREGLKPLLPLKVERPDESCIRPTKDVFCFWSGDSRVNEMTVMVMLHTLVVREHNRVATELAKVNPHWNDETLFQEAKHIMAALNQHITYNEFLPMVLGREVMAEHELVLLKEGFFTKYDKNVNPSSSNAFVTAAFRFGHSLLPSEVERWSKSHRFVGSNKLSDLLLQPYDLLKPGWADTYVMGMVNQVASAVDSSMSTETTNHMFQPPGSPFGTDLAALNIQRGRDQGLAGYNKWREWCDLPVINSWSELRGVMPNNTVNEYAALYEHPGDLDLWSAGISETPVPGSMVGPTFACIMGRQFRNFRFGDRFWYENSGWPSSFTLEQLTELRKVRLSRIICDNADDIDTIQVFTMVLPDHEINPRLPCSSSRLPSMDFTKWRDIGNNRPQATG